MIHVLALAALALTQEKPVVTSEKNPDTVKIVVTGELELDYVWRAREITAFTGGVGGLNVPGDSAAENTFEGFMAVRLDVLLSDNVQLMTEFGTKRVNGGEFNFWGQPNSGGDPSFDLVLRELQVTLNELFDPTLRAEIGISRWDFDLRGRGQSLAFDPRHSQRFNRNFTGASDDATTLGFRASDPEELEPVGLRLQYVRSNMTLELVVLPAVIEGGSVHDDEAFYAFDLWYSFDKRGSRFGGIIALTVDPGGSSTVYTYGGGLDYRGIENLEIYGEAYFQNGHQSLAAGSAQVGAFAWQAGAEYAFKGDLLPWIGLNLTWYSGDDSVGPNNKVSSFSGYENVHDLAILEDMYTGLDWDSNYKALKLSGGLALTTSNKNDLKLSAIVGLARTAQAVRFAAENTHNLGNEVDLKARWEMTRLLALTATYGILWGSEVLEDSLGGPGAAQASRTTMLFTLGLDLRF